jgi:hypothetical protein
MMTTTPVTIESLLAEREIFAQQQDAFNTHYRQCGPLALLSLREYVRQHHERWPQYLGRFETWTLGKIRRRIETKGGLCFEPGDVVLVEPEPNLRGLLRPTHVTCFSVRAGWNVAVGRWDVERL